MLRKIKDKFFLIKINFQKLGLKGYFIHSTKRLFSVALSLLTLQPIWKRLFAREKADIFTLYNFVFSSPFGDRAAVLELKNKRTINWVIPDFNPGGGGHINIFRLIDALERNNYACTITIVGESIFSSPSLAQQSIARNFRPLKAQVFLGSQNMPPAWTTFATSWMTAYTVRDFEATINKCYFIQDFEPFFYAKSSDYLWAEDTYRFGFYGITAGKWLSQKIADEYGMKTDSIGFSYDKELYSPKSPALRIGTPNLKKVFFYARPVTPRRGFELGLYVLAKVAQRFPEVEFILAGWDTTAYHIPFRHVNLGVIPLSDLADVYNSCYAALVLSFTNLSLLPLELMACRCPVVSNSGANVDWLLDAKNCLLVEPNVDALSTALIDLLENPHKREQLAESGLQFALGTSWEAECNKFIGFLDGIVNG